MLKKDVKNAKSFSVVLDEEDALELREICEMTGMSATAIIKHAVHNHLPTVRMHVNAIRYGYENQSEVRRWPLEPFVM